MRSAIIFQILNFKTWYSVINFYLLTKSPKMSQWGCKASKIHQVYMQAQTPKAAIKQPYQKLKALGNKLFLSKVSVGLKNLIGCLKYSQKMIMIHTARRLKTITRKKLIPTIQCSDWILCEPRSHIIDCLSS